MADGERAHVLVSGRVQGVAFRDSTRREAERLGLDGWVRNTQDGQVEAVFEGERDAVHITARHALDQTVERASAAPAVVRRARRAVHAEGDQARSLLVREERRQDALEVPAVGDEAALHPCGCHRRDDLIEVRMECDFPARERDVVDAVSGARFVEQATEERDRKIVGAGVIERVLVAHAVAAMQVADVGQFDREANRVICALCLFG